MVAKQTNKSAKPDSEKPVQEKLSSIVKSARDIMRKDKGLNGELDRLPQLTWIMFLKFLDDVEKIREAEVVLRGKSYVSLIESPYRWRDWAAKSSGITGTELISFINNDEAIRPDGTRGLGLLAYLRSLKGSNGRGRRDVIANVFKGVINRMINGYLLRDVINKVNGINFNSSEEMHVLGHLYESLLKELRDAAGDSGEFYTPRPVVKFMVKITDPQLAEKILDPAAGTGGFLVESFLHLEKQCQTTEDYKQLHDNSIFGIEAKSLPYLLCQMNLLLHGLEYPNIDPLNALRFSLREIGDIDRFDVILTNPPFGGEEEQGIQSNFPEDKQTNETAILFLQLLMRKLKRPIGQNKGGRCAIILPNGNPLSGEGVAERVRRELISEFNLHTIIRLPKGVFEPYTDIPTNILFFDRSGPTKEIWFFEIPLSEGRRQYSKTQPIQDSEFEAIFSWWNNRNNNDNAWVVPIENILSHGANLDIKNPNPKRNAYYSPKKFVDDLNSKGRDIVITAEEINRVFETERLTVDEDNVHLHKLDDICQLVKGKSATLKTEPGEYPLVVTAANRRTSDTYQIDASAVCIPLVSSTGHGHASMHRIHYQEGKFALANIMVALIPKDPKVCNAKYLYYLLSAKKDDYFVPLMRGLANVSLKDTLIARVEVPLPDISDQIRIVNYLDALHERLERLKKLHIEIGSFLDSFSPSVLQDTFPSSSKPH